MQTLRWLKENWLQAAILAIPFIAGRGVLG